MFCLDRLTYLAILGWLAPLDNAEDYIMTFIILDYIKSRNSLILDKHIVNPQKVVDFVVAEVSDWIDVLTTMNKRTFER